MGVEGIKIPRKLGNGYDGNSQQADDAGSTLHPGAQGFPALFQKLLQIQQDGKADEIVQDKHQIITDSHCVICSETCFAPVRPRYGIIGKKKENLHQNGKEQPPLTGRLPLNKENKRRKNKADNSAPKLHGNLNSRSTQHSTTPLNFCFHW